ncbi:MAG: sugar transferase [Patescibacteria group bacterium]|nr:sugar transferase [Patescibacteria group bacterium]
MTDRRYNQLINLSKSFVDLIVVGVSFYLPILLFKIQNREMGRGSVLIENLPNGSILGAGSIYYWLVWVVISQLVIFWTIGLYRREISFFNFEELRKAIKALTIGFLLALFLGVALRLDWEFIRSLIIFGFPTGLFLVAVERYLFYKVIRTNHKKGKWVKKIAIYDVCPTGRLLLKKLFESPQLGYLPVGFIDNKVKRDTRIKTNSEETRAEVPVLGRMADLKKIIQQEGIEELFVATPAIKEGDIRTISRVCLKNKINYRFIPNLIKEPLHRVALDSFGGIPFLRTEEPRINITTRVIKRTVDIVLSVLALILLAPVFLLVAILIRKDSKGPIIFKQKRIGKDGVSFKMYKFRTMKTNATKYAYCPADRQDKRITQIGKFLRKTSLDEIPQFLNSLKGEMSLVGPRPEMQFIVKKYNSYQRERLLVKPGITGIWQVTADRKKCIHENLDYDIYYIDNLSILLDVLVIFRTFWFAARGVGAS